VTDLLCLVEQSKADVLLPIGLDAGVAVAAQQDRIRPHVALALPSYEVFLRAHDKGQAVQLAQDVGVPVPRSTRVEDLAHLRNLAAECEYPVVLKARKSSASSGVRFANTPDELEYWYGQLSGLEGGSWQNKEIATAEEPLLQECIPGKVHDVCVIASRGRLRAALTQVRLKMNPPRGGSGIYNQTTDEPILRDYARRLVEALGWHGVAQIEFRWDERDDTPKLMEINPKFWGTLALSIEAGVDFPALACQLALEGDVEPVEHYQVGKRYRWALPHEVERALQESDKKSALKELWCALRTDAATDIQLDDPIPLLPLLANTGAKVLKKPRRKVKSSQGCFII